ncbi:MAG: 4-hydroxy-2-oxoheptanedioate aldolase [Candidatus Pelagisphaera sp.]|jgi:4-hydroxy-2-oxoheptanedioate aldolase
MNELALRKRALAGDKLVGTFVNTGSPMSAEIAGNTGLDWCLFDMEHGVGEWESLNHQVGALNGTRTAPLVRVPGLDSVYFKRALDLGAHGVMIPSVNTAEEAREAVSFSRYPPYGVRGVSGMTRCAGFGKKLDERLQSAHENTLIIAQIETKSGLENVESIAAVEGIDMLFVGPMDLSVSLGIARQLEHPDFRAACAKVVEAAKRHGKASGALVIDGNKLGECFDEGFTFVGIGSDGSMIAAGMNAVLQHKVDALGR